MTDKEKSTILELITTLYLRLNGYFTTGFIIHSTGERIDGEVDVIGVRFPMHKQDYTEHGSSIFLEVPKNIDIVIAEVKAKGQQLQFNTSLQQQVTYEAWQKMLEWVGLMTEKQISSIAIELNSLVQTVPNSQRKTLLSSKVIRTAFGDLTIRPIIFSPERMNINNADKFVNWTEINDFIWNCLCPAEKRQDCGTRYDFTSWGYGLSEIVKAYKDRQKAQTKFNSIEELYTALQNNRH